DQCTTSSQGRLLRRSFHETYLERVRAYAGTPAFKRAMRKRSVWVEGLFAEAKQWHGLHRFRLRGLVNVNIQALIVATGQNLKRWLGVTGWGRRSFPGAAGTVGSRIPRVMRCRLAYIASGLVPQ
ncbi:MAG TPA: transposase, partial [Chloroflexota bacterium]|nr:transposase [Chloroflexota bacterium]